MIAFAALLAGALAPAAAAAPLSQRVPETATRFCIDMVSHTVPIPAVGDDERRVFSRYDLAPGISDAAMQALGRVGTAMVSGATLASGQAGDGAFIVALGGSAGEICQILVYRAGIDGRLIGGIRAAMTVPARGWRLLPDPLHVAGASRLSFFKRGAGNAPFLATLTAPSAPGSIAAIVAVAAVPPTVFIPQGL